MVDTIRGAAAVYLEVWLHANAILVEQRPNEDNGLATYVWDIPANLKPEFDALLAAAVDEEISDG